jgi:hypothetical protein
MTIDLTQFQKMHNSCQKKINLISWYSSEIRYGFERVLEFEGKISSLHDSFHHDPSSLSFSKNQYGKRASRLMNNACSISHTNMEDSMYVLNVLKPYLKIADEAKENDLSTASNYLEFVHGEMPFYVEQFKEWFNEMTEIKLALMKLSEQYTEFQLARA